MICHVIAAGSTQDSFSGNQLVVTRGLVATGRTITTAAAIMILVFASFIRGGQMILKLFGLGLGLASAGLVGALIVRSIPGQSRWERVIGHERPALRVPRASRA